MGKFTEKDRSNFEKIKIKILRKVADPVLWTMEVG